jgi:cytochrome c5
MNDDQKTTAVLAGLSVKFTCLALAFWAASHAVTVGERKPLAPGAVFTNTATVRLSVAELTKSGGDVSGLDCYACHKREQPVAPKFDVAGHLIPSVAHRDVVFSRMNCAACHAPEEKVELKFDTEGKVLTPAAHTNDVARHGRTIGNDHCFNCHDPANLNELHTPGGKKLKLTDSTLLCASCHGPSYRDWEAGVHGRRNGFWNAKLGATDRKDCTSCHDPHAPAIPLLKPLPPPARVVVKGH